MTNRLTPFTRYPTDPQAALARTDTLLHFSAAMSKILGVDRELERIADGAFRVRMRIIDGMTARDCERMN